eukprot:g6202.t1
MKSHKNVPGTTKRLVIILHYGVNFVDKKISIYMKILMKNDVACVLLRNVDNNHEEKRKFKKRLQKYDEIVLLVDSFLTYDNVMRRLESTCTRLKTIIDSNEAVQIVAYSQESFQAIKTKQPNLKMYLLAPSKSHNNSNSHMSTSISTKKPNCKCEQTCKKRKYMAVEETTLPPPKYPSLCVKRKTTVDSAKKNQHIISKFVEYYNYTKAYKTSHQQIQGFTLPRVISILRGLNFQITFDNANELENINYISKRYIDFIFEILEKGSFERLELMKCNPKANACLNFVKIYNIGSSKASELYNLGYRSIRQLKTDVFNSTGPINNQLALKETLKTSLTFFDDSQHNYTLQERHQFASKIKIIARRLNLKMEICGGTRRLKKLGHDLDLLFTTNEVVNEDAAVFDVRGIGKQLLEMVKKNFYDVQLLKHDTGSFATSDTLPESREERHSIQLTVIKETESSLYRRVDFVCVPPRHWVFAVLGWTGTTMFERSLRTVNACKSLLMAYLQRPADIEALGPFSKTLITLNKKFPDLVVLALQQGILAQRSITDIDEDGKVHINTRELRPSNFVRPARDKPVWSKHEIKKRKKTFCYCIQYKPRMKSEDREQVQAYSIAFPGFLSGDGPFRKIVQSNNKAAFETEVMEYSITYLWAKLKRYYIFNFFKYLIFLTSFTFGLLLNRDIPDDIVTTPYEEIFTNPTKYFAYFLSRMALIVGIVFNLMFFKSEMEHVKGSGFFRYWKNGWNRLQLSAYLMVFFGVGFAFLKTSFDITVPYGLSNKTQGLSLVLIWTTTLSHLRGFNDGTYKFGVLIKTLVMIISDMKAFIIIMSIVVMGFGSAFVFLLPGVDNDTIRTLVIDVLTGGGEVALIIYSSSQDLDTFSFILVNGLFILFAFITIVIMLNMLIAIMGDTYENVTSNYKMEGMLSRAQVVVDLLEQYASKKDPILNPRWLVMLTPLDTDSRDTNWHGQLVELKKAVGKEVGSLKIDVEKKLNKIITMMEQQQLELRAAGMKSR